MGAGGISGGQATLTSKTSGVKTGAMTNSAIITGSGSGTGKGTGKGTGRGTGTGTGTGTGSGSGFDPVKQSMANTTRKSYNVSNYSETKTAKGNVVDVVVGEGKFLSERVTDSYIVNEYEIAGDVVSRNKEK